MKIVIAGGGSAGWMTAAYLSRAIDQSSTSITLVESDKIGTVGVGEATLPHLKRFNEVLGINESDFIRATNATIKLGIAFEGWTGEGSGYLHPFGRQGRAIKDIAFHHLYQAAINRLGTQELPRFDSFSYGVRLAQALRFHPPYGNAAESTFSYAYHVDSSLYAKYLKSYSEKYGVKRIEGEIGKVIVNERKQIDRLQLIDGAELDGDLFIDCTGFSSLLLGKALRVPFVSWRKWLRCNRAIAMQTEHAAEKSLRPFSVAKRASSGWTWRIPLQTRVGNGYVYSSDHQSDDAALVELIEQLDGPQRTSPKHLRFEAGHRQNFWSANCVGIGLSSGFLEPLESTSLFFIQYALEQLVKEMPSKKLDDFESCAARFNRTMLAEFENVRDFLILHYHSTTEADSSFWKEIQECDIPDSLKDKIQEFTDFGLVPEDPFRLFKDESWIAVLMGQKRFSFAVDPRTKGVSDRDLEHVLHALWTEVSVNKRAPLHAEALAKFSETSQ